MRYPASVSALAAAALLLLPAALAAQTAGPAAGGTRPPGCRGTNTSSSSITGVRGGQAIEFPSYTLIEDVQKDSPAERGGMRAGDLLILQDGRDLVGDPPTQPRLAGDTVHYVVVRDGAEVPLTLVLGRWDPPQGDTRTCIPVEPASGR